mmetsp:Transcript_16060/g.52335  ORF Transcript_16060/g.52335 Transcript_16060/m.52335 type:complete len:384 (-) Transcript_16060:50-1201(-)
MTRTEKLEEETFVDGFLVTEHGQKDDAEQWPPITESSVPPPKKRVKTTASRKTCAPRDAPHFITADESSEKVPRARDGADRDDDTVGYEDEVRRSNLETPAIVPRAVPPRVAAAVPPPLPHPAGGPRIHATPLRAAAMPSLLASFDAAAASSSEDEEEEETSGQWPKSQYHGVTTTGNSSKNPWRATTRIRGKPVNLGSHATEEEAARVYDKYLREHNLVGTDHRRKLNFPLPGEEEAAKRAKKPLSRPGPSTKPAARNAAVEIRAERSAAVAAEAAGDTRKPSVTEQLATTRSERDAVRLERDMLRAGRETVASERDALRVELDALRSESAAAVSERNALRAVLDAACAERDALRSERDVVQGKLACMASFKDELLAKLAPG